MKLTLAVLASVLGVAFATAVPSTGLINDAKCVGQDCSERVNYFDISGPVLPPKELDTDATSSIVELSSRQNDSPFLGNSPCAHCFHAVKECWKICMPGDQHCRDFCSCETMAENGNCRICKQLTADDCPVIGESASADLHTRQDDIPFFSNSPCGHCLRKIRACWKTCKPGDQDCRDHCSCTKKSQDSECRVCKLFPASDCSKSRDAATLSIDGLSARSEDTLGSVSDLAQVAASVGFDLSDIPDIGFETLDESSIYNKCVKCMHDILVACKEECLDGSHNTCLDQFCACKTIDSSNNCKACPQIFPPECHKITYDPPGPETNDTVSTTFNSGDTKAASNGNCLLCTNDIKECRKGCPDGMTGECYKQCVCKTSTFGNNCQYCPPEVIPGYCPKLRNPPGQMKRQASIADFEIHTDPNDTDNITETNDLVKRNDQLSSVDPQIAGWSPTWPTDNPALSRWCRDCDKGIKKCFDGCGGTFECKVSCACENKLRATSCRFCKDFEPECTFDKDHDVIVKKQIDDTDDSTPPTDPQMAPGFPPWLYSNRDFAVCKHCTNEVDRCLSECSGVRVCEISCPCDKKASYSSCKECKTFKPDCDIRSPSRLEKKDNVSLDNTEASPDTDITDSTEESVSPTNPQMAIGFPIWLYSYKYAGCDECTNEIDQCTKDCGGTKACKISCMCEKKVSYARCKQCKNFDPNCNIQILARMNKDDVGGEKTNANPEVHINASPDEAAIDPQVVPVLPYWTTDDPVVLPEWCTYCTQEVNKCISDCGHSKACKIGCQCEKKDTIEACGACLSFEPICDFGGIVRKDKINTNSEVDTNANHGSAQPTNPQMADIPTWDFMAPVVACDILCSREISQCTSECGGTKACHIGCPCEKKESFKACNLCDDLKPQCHFAALSRSGALLPPVPRALSCEKYNETPKNGDLGWSCNLCDEKVQKCKDVCGTSTMCDLSCKCEAKSMHNVCKTCRSFQPSCIWHRDLNDALQFIPHIKDAELSAEVSAEFVKANGKVDLSPNLPLAGLDPCASCAESRKSCVLEDCAGGALGRKCINDCDCKLKCQNYYDCKVCDSFQPKC